MKKSYGRRGKGAHTVFHLYLIPNQSLVIRFVYVRLLNKVEKLLNKGSSSLRMDVESLNKVSRSLKMVVELLNKVSGSLNIMPKSLEHYNVVSKYFRVNTLREKLP